MRVTTDDCRDLPNMKHCLYFSYSLNFLPKYICQNNNLKKLGLFYSLPLFTFVFLPRRNEWLRNYKNIMFL